MALLEFDRERKSMSVLAKPLDGSSNGVQSRMLFVKGAAELLIDRCASTMLEDGTIVQVDAEMRQRLIKASEKMADKALRCLALATKVTRHLFVH